MLLLRINLFSHIFFKDSPNLVTVFSAFLFSVVSLILITVIFV